MSEEAMNTGYGYESDKPATGARIKFGLNSGVTRMVKFEYNDKAGKDGTDGEALDIVFSIDGNETSYRLFPVTRAYDDKNNIIEDVRHPAFIKARKDFNANMTHILKAFISEEDLKKAFSQPIENFKRFCEVAKAALPPNFDKMILDVFGQYQYSITGDNDRTWIRLPKNVKHGRWICRHIPAKSGVWKEIRPNDNLKYVDIVKNETGEIIEENYHPFTRTEWYMNSNFANQITEENAIDNATGVSSSEQPTWK